jgi:GR25 family glycosyltransferase involved in LPS biosynthesis
MIKIGEINIAEKGFYINLDSSTDRRENVEIQINQYNITGLERFPALTDPAKFLSCTKSHLELFRQCDEDNVETIMVLEDDFQIYDTCNINGYNFEFNHTLSLVIDELKNIEWDVVLFGCNPKTYLIPVTNLLSLNYKSTGSWAYIIKNRAYKYILENSNYFRDYLAIDDWLCNLSNFNFNVYCTTPKLISHAIGFESTMMPSGKVNYDAWIEGNYQYYLYKDIKNENFVDDFRFERETTIVVVGHFVDNFMFYLRYLLHSIPQEIERCKFLIIYDTNHNSVEYKNIRLLEDYFKNRNRPINYEILYSKGGLIDSVRIMLEKIKTNYFIFLEHDWIFLKSEKIDFKGLLDTFNKYSFVHAVWFNKDDNQLKGFEIGGDSEGKETPYGKEYRINDFELTTTIRWSNNPSMLRTSKYKEWYEKYIYNPGIGINHQGQYNVEDSMIREYRDLVSKSKFEDIRNDWGTYLYGAVGSGPYVGHTDGSRRYQTSIRTMAEDNADEYIRNNPLPEND